MRLPRQEFCLAPAEANKHISLRPSPRLLFPKFSGLLPAIRLPHLSLPPLFAGDSPADPLAHEVGSESRGISPTPLTGTYRPAGQHYFLLHANYFGTAVDFAPRPRWHILNPTGILPRPLLLTPSNREGGKKISLKNVLLVVPEPFGDVFTRHIVSFFTPP